jgi:adenosine deaminase
MAGESWFERVPKVELHLHLEGAIPHEALWALIQKYGGDPSVPDLSALARRCQYRDFAHFIDMWVWKNRFLREYEDFTFVAEQVARDLARQNIRYAEVFFSPPDFTRYGLEADKLTEAIRTGLDRVPGSEVALVADLVRDFGVERAARTLAEVADMMTLGVVGIGIGGSEAEYPPEPFAPVFERARHLGFRTSAHAGEAAGPASIRGVIDALRVDRIGHGTRAGEDERLLDLLAERHIPLEMCPVSNVRTGVVATMVDHPVRRYFERGLIVTVNSDDPKMFGTSLAREYRLLEEELGFSRDDTRALMLQAVESSWLPEHRRRALADTFRADPCWRDG